MKLLLSVIILIFSLQSWTKADDIRDFQIEGMGIGDSLLNYYNKEEIKSKIFMDYPKSDKYKRFYSYKDKSFLQYEGVQVNFKKGDKNYIIDVLAGEIQFKDNINGCLDLQRTIVRELDKMFTSVQKEKINRDKSFDKSGKSKSYMIGYIFKSGEQIIVGCDDWSKEISDKHNLQDGLSVSLRTLEFINFLNNEAY
ncbi:hypothetical protein OA516_01135 [Candidatus Pelagibacter sp.]|nr:hypothetical protein [Candidatus Pelagibacter sp.]